MSRPPKESADATESRSETASAGRSTRHNLWALAAGLLAVGGVAGSVFAADSVARGSPRRALHVSMAKAAADEAAAFAARVALQVHGAIGYTWDHDLHVFMRRAWSLGREWGDATFHRARVAEAVLGGMTPIGPGTTF